jgi:hypothetical protein
MRQGAIDQLWRGFLCDKDPQLPQSVVGPAGRKPTEVGHLRCCWLLHGSFQSSPSSHSSSDNRRIGLAVGGLNVRHRIGQMNVVHCPEARQSKRFLDVR